MGHTSIGKNYQANNLWLVILIGNRPNYQSFQVAIGQCPIVTHLTLHTNIHQNLLKGLFKQLAYFFLWFTVDRRHIFNRFELCKECLNFLGCNVKVLKNRNLCIVSHKQLLKKHCSIDSYWNTFVAQVFIKKSMFNIYICPYLLLI